MARDLIRLSSTELERAFVEARVQPLTDLPELPAYRQQLHQMEIGDLARRIQAIEEETRQLRDFIKVSSVPLYTLRSETLELKEPPLNVAMEQRDAEEFVACLYDISIFGYGETIPEALDDFRENIISQFHYLSEKEAEVKLGKLPEKQLRFLKSILVKLDA